MGTESLKAFLHEYRVNFPVGIDRPSGDDSDPIPKTMRAYNMQGTPTLLLFDRLGYLRKQKFGHEQDLVLGAEMMALIEERGNLVIPKDEDESPGESCSVDRCGNTA